MRFVFVVDPLSDLLPHHDTSVALMEAVQRRGADVWVAGAADLGIDGDGAAAWARPVVVSPAELRDGTWRSPAAWWRAGPHRRLSLGDGDAVLMRLDPPVDGAYLRATFVLDVAVRQGALVVNSPGGLREGNEKLLPLAVEGLAPDTILSARPDDLRKALGRWGVAVAKPLEGAGGRGVVMLREGDPGLAALIDLVTRQGTRQVVLQEYLHEASEGDKRIFLLDGQPIGAVNRRAPAADFRCNLAVGAVAEETSLDDVETELCRRLLPELRRLGLPLVGVDVIGGRITEVNVTSPTGLREIEAYGGDRPSDRVVEWIVATVGGARGHRAARAAGGLRRSTRTRRTPRR